MTFLKERSTVDSIFVYDQIELDNTLHLKLDAQ